MKWFGRAQILIQGNAGHKDHLKSWEIKIFYITTLLKYPRFANNLSDPQIKKIVLMRWF
jgi:hypothetical protein